MPNNGIKNTINPKKKVSYADIKKIVEDDARNEPRVLRDPNYNVEHNNMKSKSKKLLKKSKKEVIDYSHFKIN